MPQLTRAERARRLALLATGFYVCSHHACAKRLQPQPLDQFTRNSKMANGIDARCRTCRDAYRTRPDVRDRTNRWNRKDYRKRVQRGDERQGAWESISHAVATGKLPPAKTLPCAHCPKQARDYHHHRGYARRFWLDVIPLCRKCHPIADLGVPLKPRPSFVLVTHCLRGHDYAVSGTTMKDGRRYCRDCRNERRRKH